MAASFYVRLAHWLRVESPDPKNRDSWQIMNAAYTIAPAATKTQMYLNDPKTVITSLTCVAKVWGRCQVTTNINPLKMAFLSGPQYQARIWIHIMTLSFVVPGHYNSGLHT